MKTYEQNRKGCGRAVMRTKKVNRYWCDFCKKAGLSAGHMKDHEIGCTMNPNRDCRVCKMLQEDQKPISELVALLPTDVWTEDAQENKFVPDEQIPRINAALPALRKATGNCPACIMAAIRQANIPVPCATDFDFTSEMQSIWNDINNAKSEAVESL